MVQNEIPTGLQWDEHLLTESFPLLLIVDME